jgi:hypothetical protein
MQRRLLRSALAAIVVAPIVVLFGVHGAAAGAVPGSARFAPVGWTHLVDTRKKIGLAGSFRAGQTRVINAAGHAGVPKTASAVLVDVTTIKPARAGSVTVWPGDVKVRPSITTVSVTGSGQSRSSSTIVKLGRGRLRAYSSMATGLVVDVEGYWVPAATSTSGRYRALVPSRLVDSRVGRPQGTTKPPARGFAPGTRQGYLLPLAAWHNKAISPIPASGVSAIVLSVTVTKAQKSGAVKVWAGDLNHPPTASAFWVDAGRAVSNLVTVPIYRAGDGRWRKYTDFELDGGGQLAVDLIGYFSSSTAPRASDGLFVPRAPGRVLGAHAVAAGSTTRIGIAGHGGMASARIRAVALQLAIGPATATGSATAYPSTSPRPSTTTVSYAAHDRRAALSLAELGTDSRIAVFSSAHIKLSAYVTGWFLSPPVQTSGKRLRLLYVVPKGVAVHPSWVEAIRRENESAGEWLMTQNSGKRYRWQTDALGFVQVNTVRLTQTAAQVSTLASARNALLARGFNDPNVIYAVYLDASGQACGITSPPDDAPVYSFDTMRVCSIYPNPTSAGWPNDTSYVMAHEETHALGAVASCAPHYNSYIPGHTNDDPRDLLWEPRSAQDHRARDFANLKLDPGHDDYFEHAANGCLDIASDPIWFAPH